MKDVWKKVTGFLVGEAEDDVVEEEVLEKEQPIANNVMKKEKPTADGTAAYAPTNGTSKSFEKYSAPRFSHNANKRASKEPDMNIIVFNIDAFDEVKMVADALKQKRAVLVNYEKVDTSVQKRICDFVNGVCYVLNGEVKRVTGTMVLYVPENISIGNGLIHNESNIFDSHAVI